MIADPRTLNAINGRLVIISINNKEWLENLYLFLNKTGEYCKENNS